MDKKSCDVVVIGAGIGGLCAAARLSHAGYKTMVLEKMPILGGRYTHVDYKGYRVPTGAVVISYGEKDPVLRTLNEVGGDTSFEMRPMSSRSHLPKYRIGGEDHEMPAKGALWHVISIASRNSQEEERLLNAIKRAYSWQEPSDSITVSEWLLSLTDNNTIYNIFQNLSHQIDGGNAYEIPAGQLFREMRGLMTISPLVPQNDLQDVIESLAKVITDNGGEILTRSRVQSILVEDGAATVVEAKCQGNELQIRAKSVVSNVGPKRTVALAGEEHFDRGYLKEVKEQRQLQGILFILSSDGPLYDWPGGLYTIDTRRPYLWHDFTLVWPEWALPFTTPKGSTRYFWLTSRIPFPSSTNAVVKYCWQTTTVASGRRTVLCRGTTSSKKLLLKTSTTLAMG